MKNDISLARILLATACPGSPALWAGNFTFYEIINVGMMEYWVSQTKKLIHSFSSLKPILTSIPLFQYSR